MDNISLTAEFTAAAVDHRSAASTSARTLYNHSTYTVDVLNTRVVTNTTCRWENVLVSLKHREFE